MRKYWMLAIGLIVILAACGSPSPAVPASPELPAGPASTAPQLAGTAWVVTGIAGGATLAEHRPTLEFSGDRASGLAGCNRFSAGFTQAGNVLNFAPAAMTAMACSPDRVMTQEQTFGSTLATIAGVRTSAAGLELLDAAGNVAMTLEPAPAVPDKPLVATTWRLSGIIAADAMSSPSAGTTVTFSIGQGQISGRACNSFHGPVDTNGGTFRAGPLLSTKMACAQAGENAQESKVLTGLEAATSYSIKGALLTLKADDGTGLEFQAN